MIKQEWEGLKGDGLWLMGFAVSFAVRAGREALITSFKAAPERAFAIVCRFVLGQTSQPRK